MYVTLNIILDCIQQYELEVHTAPFANPRFNRVVLLPDTEQTGELNTNYLYICKLSERLKQREYSGEGVYFVCLRDRLRDEAESGFPLDNTVIVNVNITLTQLFGLLQEMFCQVAEWRMSMADAMTNGCDLQTILEMSKAVIGNFIAVNDAAFRLVAYTGNIEINDPISVRLLENGFHPEMTIELFRKTERFDFWEKTDFYVDKGHVYSNYTLVGRVFRINNNYVAHAVMTCNNYEVTLKMLDLYNMLCEYIAKFAAKDWENRDAKILIYNSFLLDMIEGNVTNFEEAESRLGLTVSGKSSLCLFRISIVGVANTLAGKIGQEFSERFPMAQMTLHDHSIILLTAFHGEAPEGQVRAVAGEIGDLMSVYNLRGGASSLFDSLKEFRSAYEQSEYALRCGLRLSQSALYFFDDILQFCMLSDSYSIIHQWRNSQCGRALRKLAEYDAKNSSNNMQLLYAYLSNERKARETGEIMHLHRNSVLYRIGHILKIMDLESLDSSELRIRLLISFMMSELYGLEET